VTCRIAILFPVEAPADMRCAGCRLGGFFDPAALALAALRAYIGCRGARQQRWRPVQPKPRTG
jgi:hypothetical protein